MAAHKSASAIIRRLEARVSLDEFKRGIGAFAHNFQGELESSANVLQQPDVKHVGIITGFPCNLKHDPPTETDGPLGAFSIARALVLLGKNVTVVTDECNFDVVNACRNFSDNSEASDALQKEQQILNQIDLSSFPPTTEWSPKQEARLTDLANTFDHVIAIERAGPSRDGTYRTMRALDMSHIVAPLDRILSLHSRRGVRMTLHRHSCNANHVC